MYSGYISDCGLSYSSESLPDLTIKLHEYLAESYGSYNVYNCKTEETLSSCKKITSPGEYLIKLRTDKNNQIYCKIS